VPQHSRREVGAARPRVDDGAVGRPRDRVDREVAALEVLLERHRAGRVEFEPRVARRGFALRARERVLLAGLRVQEHREIFADAAEALRRELVGRRADDDPIALLDR